jgi:hypothetical protein
MKKTLTLFLILISTQIGFSQTEALSRILTETLSDNKVVIKLNQIVHQFDSYKPGERIRINTQFSIDDNGNLFDIGVRAPLPQIEIEVAKVIGTITIP